MSSGGGRAGASKAPLVLDLNASRLTSRTTEETGPALPTCLGIPTCTLGFRRGPWEPNVRGRPEGRTVPGLRDPYFMKMRGRSKFSKLWVPLGSPDIGLPEPPPPISSTSLFQPSLPASLTLDAR